MFVFHSWRSSAPPLLQFMFHRGIDLCIREKSTDLFHSYSTGAKQNRMISNQGNDRRFHSHTAFSAINNHFNFSIHIVKDMPCRCRTRFSGEVCRRGCNRHPRCTDNCPCHRVRWETDCHGIQSPGSFRGDAVRFWQDNCQWTRPKMFSQQPCRLRDISHQCGKLLKLCNMNNQGIVLRSSLCLKNPSNRLSVQCIGAQPVDCFRGNGNQTAFPQDLARLFNFLLLALQINNLCVKRFHICSPVPIRFLLQPP